MGRVLSNNESLSFVVETALGTAATTGWKLTEPNELNMLGADIGTTERSPISKNRQRRKGGITSLDSPVEFTHDLTMEIVNDMAAGYFVTVWKGAVPRVCTAVSTTAYTVDSGTTLAAGRLVVATGFSTLANNGLKVVDTGSGATSITIVAGSGLVVETPVAGALVELCGVQGASGDITITAAGHLAATTLDFTTLGLTVGQWIWVGGAAAATQFATATHNGWARVRIIAAGLLTLDKKPAAWSTEAGAAKTIHVYFGRWVRQVAVDHADYLESSLTWELANENLGSGGADEYEYPIGNYFSRWSLEVELESKATCTMAFLGQDTGAPTATRKTGASAAGRVIRSKMLNTSSDVARLRLTEYDETGVSTDFKALTVTFDNNVNGEKVIGYLGNKYLNMGNSRTNIEATVLFTSSAVLSAIRNNRTMSIDFGLRGENGGVVVDVPSVTLSGGRKELPINQTVTVQFTAGGFQDDALGYTSSLSTFPYLPPQSAFAAG